MKRTIGARIGRIVPVVAVAMVVGVLAGGLPAYAYSANSWYRHPGIYSAWNSPDGWIWFCGETKDGTAFSTQGCVTLNTTIGSLQEVIIVRNRTGSTRAASVQGFDTRYDWGFSCKSSGLAASDYSGCFGPVISGSRYPCNDDIAITGSVKDQVSGATIQVPAYPYKLLCVTIVG